METTDTNIQTKQVTYTSKRLKQSITLDVTQDGRVFYRGRELEIKKMEQTGYLYAYLGKDMKDYGGMLPVHRLVCMAFYGAPKGNKRFCDHIDGDRTNNHYKNLRWVTRKQNASKRKRNVQNGAPKWSHSMQIIKLITQDGHFHYFMNVQEAAKWIGCSTVLIYRVLNPDDWPKTARGNQLSWCQIKSGMTVRFTCVED